MLNSDISIKFHKKLRYAFDRVPIRESFTQILL